MPFWALVVRACQDLTLSKLGTGTAPEAGIVVPGIQKGLFRWLRQMPYSVGLYFTEVVCECTAQELSFLAPTADPVCESPTGCGDGLSVFSKGDYSASEQNGNSKAVKSFLGTSLSPSGMHPLKSFPDR